MSLSVTQSKTATASRNLKQEKIRVVSRHEAITVGSGETLRKTILLMQEAEGDCALICNDRRLVGIITERDILNKVLGHNVTLDDPVDRFMTTNPGTLTADGTVQEALEMMERGGYRNIPLVDGEGCVAGVLRSQDILEYVAEAFPEEVLNLPPRPHQVMEEPEGG
ncbi:MAG: CBS domain-containing protein [Dehalococcoidia bacterium]|nr:CBS domain-containing protein [Dehalococcoidia bacterium]